MVHHGFWDGPTMFHLLIAHMRGHSYMWAPMPCVGSRICMLLEELGLRWTVDSEVAFRARSLHPLDIG